jgi:hypothetical protein
MVFPGMKSKYGFSLRGEKVSDSVLTKKQSKLRSAFWNLDAGGLKLTILK